MKSLLLTLGLLLSFPLMGNAEVWISSAPIAGYFYDREVVIQEEFLSGSTSSATSGSIGWQLVGGTTTLGGGVVDHPGFLRRDTSAVISTLTSLNHFTGTATAWNQNIYLVRWIVRPNNIDANTTLRIGSFSSFLANPPSDGVYFEKLDADTNWFFVTRAGGVQTRTNTGVAVVADWTELTVQRNSTSAWGSINKSVVATHTTNLSLNGHAVTQIINSVAASKTLDHDYCEIRLTITR